MKKIYTRLMTYFTSVLMIFFFCRNIILVQTKEMDSWMEVYFTTIKLYAFFEII
ncbi:hypothetical protein [Aquimarina hainanensis]|uniref:hypothetical protein n=1 Tax=Aquimarina hainanensis TaxID=1578017 RepID=UPI003621DDC6